MSSHTQTSKEELYCLQCEAEVHQERKTSCPVGVLEIVDIAFALLMVSFSTNSSMVAG